MDAQFIFSSQRWRNKKESPLIDPAAAAVQGVIKELKSTITPAADPASDTPPAQGYAPDSGEKLNKLIGQ